MMTMIKEDHVEDKQLYLFGKYCFRSTGIQFPVHLVLKLACLFLSRGSKKILHSDLSSFFKKSSSFFVNFDSVVVFTLIAKAVGSHLFCGKKILLQDNLNSNRHKFKTRRKAENYIL